jgi:hypothetical protein
MLSYGAQTIFKSTAKIGSLKSSNDSWVRKVNFTVLHMNKTFLRHKVRKYSWISSPDVRRFSKLNEFK